MAELGLEPTSVTPSLVISLYAHPTGWKGPAGLVLLKGEGPYAGNASGPEENEKDVFENVSKAQVLLGCNLVLKVLSGHRAGGMAQLVSKIRHIGKLWVSLSQ